MYIEEFGDATKPKILLIHPMLTTGEDMYPLMEGLGDGYHYIIPFLDAHTKAKTEFLSAEKEVEELAKYFKEKQYRNFEMVFGSSLGSVIATYLYAREDLNFNYAFLDCAPFVEGNGLLFALISEFVLHLKDNIKCFRSSKDKCLHTPLGTINATMVDALEAMSEDSVNNILYSCTHFSFPYITIAKQRKMFFNFGKRDFNRVAVGTVRSKYPLATIEFESKMGHCEFLLLKPLEYAKWILNKIN